MSEKQILARVKREEEAEKKGSAAAKAAKEAIKYDRNTDQKVIDAKRLAYLKQNKNNFEK